MISKKEIKNIIIEESNNIEIPNLSTKIIDSINFNNQNSKNKLLCYEEKSINKLANKRKIKLILITSIVLFFFIILITSLILYNKSIIESKKVTIKFVSSLDETLISEDTYIIGNDIDAPEPKTYLGYTFIGWDKDITTVKQNEIVYALYEKNIYTIIFKSGINDEVIDSIGFELGEKIIYPEPKEYENYIFVGWNKEISNLEQNEIVYALYEKSSFSVTYKTKYGDKERILGQVTYKWKEKIIPPASLDQTGYGKTIIGFDKDLGEIKDDCIVYVEYQILSEKQSYKLSDIYWWIKYISINDVTNITVSVTVGYDETYNTIEDEKKINEILNLLKTERVTKSESQESIFGGHKYKIYLNVNGESYSFRVHANRLSVNNIYYDITNELYKMAVNE